MIFHTFEQLVAHAKSLGVTHVTMGNYHSGGFWIYDKPVLEGMDELEIEVLTDVLGKGWQKRKSIRAVAHFHDGKLCNYRDWSMSSFISTGGIELRDQFVPIDQAVDWYVAWNNFYEVE